MYPKIIAFILLLILNTSLPAQVNDTINKVDMNVKKQGHWIKKYPDGHVQYEGYFKDDNPTGTFRRYFDNDTLMSVMVFSNEGKTADATIFHPNGHMASKGMFVNQRKEGKWSFYSSETEGYLICEEEYRDNMKDGPSFKYFPGKITAEKLTWSNDVRNGDWFQYYPNGNTFLKATYADGKLQGEFKVFFSNGKLQYAGQYKDDSRDGLWNIYNPDGSLKYKVEYESGRAKNSDLDKQESDYLDSLEKNKGKFSDPEKTGTVW